MIKKNLLSDCGEMNQDLQLRVPRLLLLKKILRESTLFNKILTTFKKGGVEIKRNNE